MLAFFQRILDWIKSLFWKEEMELTLVGLQYSGKTTFVNVIAVSENLRLFNLSIIASKNIIITLIIESVRGFINLRLLFYL